MINIYIHVTGFLEKLKHTPRLSNGDFVTFKTHRRDFDGGASGVGGDSERTR